MHRSRSLGIGSANSRGARAVDDAERIEGHGRRRTVIVRDADRGDGSALTAKLRELEKQKRDLERQVAPVVQTLVTGAADQFRELVKDLPRLGEAATPSELETARTALHELIREIEVVEPDGEVTFRPRLNGDGYKDGAQEVSHGSLSIRARR